MSQFSEKQMKLIKISTALYTVISLPSANVDISHLFNCHFHMNQIFNSVSPITFNAKVNTDSIQRTVLKS